jgi:hypothetical protein
MTFFDEGAMVWAPFGACRHMPLSPGLTCPTLPAMSVQCTMTCPPDPPVLVDPDCCFFVKRRSAVETSNRNPTSENGHSLHRCD